MKKGRIWAVLLVACFLCLPLSVSAESGSSSAEIFAEEWEKSGAALWDLLPEETRYRLETLGITANSLAKGETLSPETAIRFLWDSLCEQAAGPAAVAALILGVLLVTSLADNLRFLSDREGIRSLFQTIATLAVCGTLIGSLGDTIRHASEAMQSALVFLSGFVPVYATVLACEGHIATAAAYQSSLLWLSECLMLLLSGVVWPLLLSALTLHAVGSVTPTWRLSRIGGAVCHTCGWGVGLVSTCFSGVLSLQALTGTAADTLSGRAIRFSIANLIPVVGGALSETFLTVKSCLTAVRSTVGVFGIVVAAVLLLPPIFLCIGWNVLLSLTSYTADLFSSDAIAGLAKSLQTVLKTVLAVLVITLLFLIVSISVLMRVGGGT